MGEVSPGVWGLIGGLGCCCPLLVVAIAFVIYKLVSKQGGSAPVARFTDNRPQAGGSPGVSGAMPARAAQYSHLISRVSDEGFYLFNEFLTPGSVVHYRYRGNSGWVSRSVSYQPGPQGHFIFLGRAPGELEVTDVVPFTPSEVMPSDQQPTMMNSGVNLPPRRPPAETRRQRDDDDDYDPPEPRESLSSQPNSMPSFPSAY